MQVCNDAASVSAFGAAPLRAPTDVNPMECERRMIPCNSCERALGLPAPEAAQAAQFTSGFVSMQGTVKAVEGLKFTLLLGLISLLP